MSQETQSAEIERMLDVPPPPRVAHNRTPPDVEEQIIALHIAGHSRRQIAEHLDMPFTTVHSVIARAREEKSETLIQLRTERKERWVDDAWEFVNEITKAGIDGARTIAQQAASGERELSPRDIQSLAVSMGIYHDKIALITGEGTTSGGSGASAQEIGNAVLNAWQAGREAGIAEARPRDVDGQVIDAE